MAPEEAIDVSCVMGIWLQSLEDRKLRRRNNTRINGSCNHTLIMLEPRKGVPKQDMVIIDRLQRSSSGSIAHMLDCVEFYLVHSTWV